MSYGAELALLISDVPKLDGAACKGRHRVFDARPPKTPDRDELHAYAKGICTRRCPALSACRKWLASLEPHQRPEGIVAGQFIESSIWRHDRTGRTYTRPGRPRKYA